MLFYVGKKLNWLMAYFIFLFPSSSYGQEAELINVKLAVMESLSPAEPSSSDRYKRFLESAVYFALGENENQLKICGYKISTEFSYFETLNGLSLIETAKKLNTGKKWFIIGPRRSNHIIAASTILHDVPLLSTMANSSEINKYHPLVYSMYPSASLLAEKMVIEVNKQKLGGSYGTLVDARCHACIEFAKAFKRLNANHQEAFYLEVADNTPNINELIKAIQASKIEYLLLPNYSELTGYVISELQKIAPHLKYVGSDGWGEDNFSLIQGYPISEHVNGISIRVGPQQKDKNNFYNVYSLDREINDQIVSPPYSVYAIVSAIRTLTKDLCESKAKDKDEFNQYYNKKSKDHFQCINQYAIYKLTEDKLVFSHYLS